MGTTAGCGAADARSPDATECALLEAAGFWWCAQRRAWVNGKTERACTRARALHLAAQDAARRAERASAR